jgi:hypothetical protein
MYTLLVLSTCKVSNQNIIFENATWKYSFWIYFLSELHVPRATFIVFVAPTTTFFSFFLKLRDISGSHAHQICTPYTDFLCHQIYMPYISGARNRILILSFPSDQTITVGSFLSKLCDHAPIKQHMHVLPVYMICFLRLLPQITPD